MTTHKNTTKINLIESWIAAETSITGFLKRHALQDLNKELGKNYDMNRLNKWQRGDEAIPQPVQNYMMINSILYALQQNGAQSYDFTDDQLNMIAKMLTPPDRD